MNRRVFAKLLAGLPGGSMIASPPARPMDGALRLEALAGPRIPDSWSLPGQIPGLGGSRVIEFRVYRCRARLPKDMLERAGIRPLIHGRELHRGANTDRAYVIPFESLEARALAWRKLSVDDPDWAVWREKAAVRHITIYRVANCTREISRAA